MNQVQINNFITIPYQSDSCRDLRHWSYLPVLRSPPLQYVGGAERSVDTLGVFCSLSVFQGVWAPVLHWLWHLKICFQVLFNYMGSLFLVI